MRSWKGTSSIRVHLYSRRLHQYGFLSSRDTFGEGEKCTGDAVQVEDGSDSCLTVQCTSAVSHSCSCTLFGALMTAKVDKQLLLRETDCRTYTLQHRTPKCPWTREDQRRCRKSKEGAQSILCDAQMLWTMTFVLLSACLFSHLCRESSRSKSWAVVGADTL